MRVPAPDQQEEIWALQILPQQVLRTWKTRLSSCLGRCKRGTPDRTPGMRGSTDSETHNEPKAKHCRSATDSTALSDLPCRVTSNCPSLCCLSQHPTPGHVIRDFLVILPAKQDFLCLPGCGLVDRTMEPLNFSGHV